jgi:hypothetical protein
MADHRRRDEGGPLAPARTLKGRREAGSDSATGEDARWSGQTQTQEQPRVTDTDGPSGRPAGRGADDDTQKTSPIAAAAAAVSAAKERALGPSPRREGESREQEQLRAATGARPSGGRSRRARLRLVRVDPWSVMKTSFLLSIAFGIMCIVAVFIVWSVLGAADVFGSINDAVAQAAGEEIAIEDYIGMDRVLSFTMLVAVLDVVLITAIATLGAFLYNLAASLLGGLEVTLAEDDH